MAAEMAAKGWSKPTEYWKAQGLAHDQICT